MTLDTLIRLVLVAIITMAAISAIPQVQAPASQFSSDPIPESTADPGKSTVDGVNSTVVEHEIHKRVNEIRSDYTVNTLRFDEKFSGYGREHSYDMENRDFFAHTNPDNESLADRIPNVFERCKMIGENLYYRTYSGSINESEIATDTVQAWMNSEGHRENLVRPVWDYEGIGVYISETDSGIIVYISQEFCQK